MADIREQRAALKFCFLLGRSASDAVDMLSTAYKEHALKRTQVYEWYSRFKRGDMSIEDIERPGRPSTSRTDENVEKIRARLCTRIEGVLLMNLLNYLVFRGAQCNAF